VDILKKLKLGIKPIINAAGPVTMYSGSTMRKEVVDAMSEAAKTTIRIDELQATAGKYISKITGAEAGYITCGCTASLTIAAAACLTGYDADKINRLPDTSDIPNEVLIAYNQRNGYDHAIRAAGAKIINVGMSSSPAIPGKPYNTLVEDFEVNITDRTAAIAFFTYGNDIPPLEEVVLLSKKYNIPVILDAANTVPPIENLRNFISMGVDLVAISGGKGIRGPQASGLLFGKKDLIASAALNCFTPGFAAGYVSYKNWKPPSSLIDKNKLKGKLPHHPIGRGFKVSKEAIIGLLTALQIIVDEEKNLEEINRLKRILDPIVKTLKDIPGVKIEKKDIPSKGFPALIVNIDQKKLGFNAEGFVNRLNNEEPRIYFFTSNIDKGEFVINSCSLNTEQVKIIVERFKKVIKKK